VIWADDIRSKGLVSAAGAGVGAELGGVDMEEEVKEAYEIIKNIDILDVSPGKHILQHH